MWRNIVIIRILSPILSVYLELRVSYAVWHFIKRTHSIVHVNYALYVFSPLKFFYGFCAK